MKRAIVTVGLMFCWLTICGLAGSAASAADFVPGQTILLKLDAAVGGPDKPLEFKQLWLPLVVKEVDGNRLLLAGGLSVDKQFALTADEAIAYYTDILKADPKNADALYGRSSVWRAKQDPKRTVEDATAVIELAPDCAVAYHHRGAAHTDMDELDEGIADLSTALKLAPNEAAASIFCNRALAWRKKGEFANAIQDCNAGLLFSPDSAELFLGRGQGYAKSDQLDLAIADYNRALKLDPALLETYVRRALVLMMQDKYEEAKQDCDELLRHNRYSTDPRVYFVRGECLSHRGRRAMAIDDFSAAIDLESDEARLVVAYVTRGIAWADEKDDGKAIADFDEAIRLDPDCALAYGNRASSWGRKGNIDKSIEDATVAIRLDPQLPEPYLVRGYSWTRKKEFDKAIADLDIAIRLDPKSAFSFVYRGQSYAGKKEFDKAIADFDEAIGLDPQNGVAYQWRARAWVQTGEYDKAIADFSEAIRISPKDSAGYSARAEAWKGKKDYEHALADYVEALRLTAGKRYAYVAHNNIAWLLATRPDSSVRDGARAVAEATKAGELTEWNSAKSLDTLAAAYAETGDFDSAVKYAGQSLELAPDNAAMKEHRKLFESHKPLRAE